MSLYRLGPRPPSPALSSVPWPSQTGASRKTSIKPGCGSGPIAPSIGSAKANRPVSDAFASGAQKPVHRQHAREYHAFFRRDDTAKKACTEREAGPRAGESFAPSSSQAAPQPGFEPGTLRLTAGRDAVSRSLLNLAARCQIARRRQQNQTTSDFRFVPLLASLCRYLLHSKGKKRAMSPGKDRTQRRRSSFGEGHSRWPRKEVLIWKR